MADVYSAIILDNNYWDGTTSWAGEVSEAARDSKYGTRRFTSMAAWESDRDSKAAAGDVEYANIFGPWTSHDTTEFTWFGWTNAPAKCVVQTIGTDARSQDGKFDSNNCYVLESDNTAVLLTYRETDTVEFIGIQFYNTSAAITKLVYFDEMAADCLVSKCYFKDTTNTRQGIRILPAAGDLTIVNSIFEGFDEAIRGDYATKIYNCTISGCVDNDAIEDDGGVWTVKNCAVFNNLDDFQNPDTIDYCASDDQDGTNSQNMGGNAAGWNAALTDYANGDFTVKDINSVLYQTGESHTNDADVPTDDIIGTARVDGSESIGAYEYVAAATTAAPTSLTPTTLAPTTVAPTTLAPTTGAPTTAAPTTAAPTTAAPTTPAPTTAAPTTGAPTTAAPTTVAPTTAAPPPTTLAPTTAAPTTSAPTTAAPTLAPTTVAPTTPSPTTVAPTTSAPTAAPSTAPPTTLAPTTPVPPTTLAPTTPALTTLAPTTAVPETICIKELNSIITKEFLATSFIAKEILLKSVITKEIRFNGYLC